MSEERCSDEVAVESWDCLSGIYIAELHEWRLVLGFNDDGLSEIVLFGEG